MTAAAASGRKSTAVCDANEAVASVAYRLNELIAIYPITPSSPMAESCDEWSAAGRGNYWSDNPAFDLNGDGIADTAYRPNDIVDQVVWRYPAAKLLLNSPAVQLVRWAQAEFPNLHPGGVVDSAPLMRPPVVSAAHLHDGKAP